MVALRVDLIGNKLTRIENSMFHGSTISTLNLYRNEIEEIEKNTFRKIADLSDINLSSNKLKVVGDIFQDIPNLGQLYIKMNRIELLPPDSFRGTRLFWISLAENNLTRVTIGVFNNLPLTGIDLAQNQISSIEGGSFANISTLGYLYMSHNRLVNLKPSFFEGMSTKLDSLDVDSNNISDIEPSTFRQFEISTFSLRHNKLAKIKKRMFDGADIRYLSLDQNEINCIEIGAFDDTDIEREISLTENRLKEIKKGMFRISLDHVYLDSNEITTIDEDALGTVELSELHIHDNPISKKNE
nr:insulin-like growth factor-binding protein complex acid labile subunit [Leptinotarsa decemlineata]